MSGRPIALILDPEDPRHGSMAGHNAHVKMGDKSCEKCLRAKSRYDNTLRSQHDKGVRRRVPATGPQRRVQSLVALGYNFALLGREFGMSQQAVQQFALDRKEFVLAATAERVSREFKRLAMTPPPESTVRQRQAATYARTVARRHGWVPPLAWDDIDNDKRPTMSVVLNREKKAPVRDRLDYLTTADAEGRTITAAAEALGVSVEALNRWCKRHDHMSLYWRLAKRDPAFTENQHTAA